MEDSVVFIGFTDNVGFFLKHSKVFVMASKVEGFPNSMVEAMACGVPIVIADCPGESANQSFSIVNMVFWRRPYQAEQK